MWEAQCERVATARPCIILWERMWTLILIAVGKSLEGLKQINGMIRFWSWKRFFSVLCEKPGWGQNGFKDTKQEMMGNG